MLHRCIWNRSFNLIPLYPQKLEIWRLRLNRLFNNFLFSLFILLLPFPFLFLLSLPNFFVLFRLRFLRSNNAVDWSQLRFFLLLLPLFLLSFSFLLFLRFFFIFLWFSWLIFLLLLSLYFLLFFSLLSLDISLGFSCLNFFNFYQIFCC